MTAERLRASLAARYRIERELGAGGMATVYLAQDLRHDRKVAVKVLRPELAAVIGAERFLAEIKTTANLQHPHILPLFDSGAADSFLFYVMPFIEGESLRDRLNREKQLPIGDAVRIATEVAGALDYAHRHNVIHRDIKPENVLLHDGRALVADFGIALAASKAGGTRMTETGMSLGTPTYMSPEQAMGEREITARSDVYALGCVLYELLTGDPPFTGSTAQAIVARVLTETPRPITAQRHTIPPHVEVAVLTALEKLPADRFPSAALFADALANASFTTQTAASGRATQADQVRRGLALPAAALGALVLGVAGAKLVWRDHAQPATTTRLMLEFPASQQPRLPTFNRPILAQLPDGSGFLYSGPGANTRTQLWIRRWDRFEATRLSQTLDDGCCTVFSPHGDSLAYLTPPHLLHVVPLSGGLPITVADSGLTPVTDYGGGVDWGSDGMLYASGLDGLIRISPRGGKAELVAALDAGRGDLRYLWPAVLPGARGALVTVVPRADPTNPERASIGVVDFRTGKVTVMLQGTRAIYAPTRSVIFSKPNGVLWAAPFDLRSLVVTGSARELTDTIAIGVGGFGDFSLSPGGALAYTKGVVQSYQAVWVSRNGESRPVAADVSDYGLDTPALSPDGRRLAISMSGLDGKSTLWVKPLNGGPKVRLTFDGSYNARAAWRPGSGAISFTSDREQAGVPTRLFEVAADGSGRLTRPELHDRRAIGAHTWSPDGKWLVFRTDDQEAGNGDIMGIRPGVDTVPRALVATPAEELSPAVSFDGRWIAYSSNETGRREVFVRPFPRTGDARYQISTTGGTNPTWNRNGRELFYLDAEGNMVAVPVLGGATFQTGQPMVLFGTGPYESNPWGRMYDVTPDGQRFVMIRGETDAAVHVVIVFNFLAELQQQMARP
jgi:eukaryotic-like serine/threonine-protein kinase